jgi:RNA polymerase sigma-70 factor (ECF subfamily)
MEDSTPEDRDAADESLSPIRLGGEAALANVFMRHRERLRRMIQVRLDRRIAGRIDPSDVLQEAFLDASRRLGEYLANPPMPLFLWLRFLTGQRLMAIHRQHLGTQKRDPRQEISIRGGAMPRADSASLSMHLMGKLTTPSRAAIRGEIQARLEQLFAQLDPLDREILALRHYEDLTNHEAAEELGISPAAASKRYIRALERFRAVLASVPGILGE